MSSLTERMLKANSKDVKSYSATESEYMSIPDSYNIPTNLPMFNLALSGDYKRGYDPGVNILAGESGVGKTLLTWLAARAFQKKNPEGVVLFYDSEQGTPEDYLISLGLDVERIVHIPIMNMEQLKFDMSAKLKEMNDEDDVFIIVDSLGNVASIKEVEDAEDEKSVADMSRAKSAKSLFRIITPLITQKRAYFFGIQHVYKEIGLFPKTIVGGGTASIYASNTILTLTKAQEKEGTDLVGIKINMGVYKSRYVHEKTKFTTTLLKEGGFKTFAGFGDVLMSVNKLAKPKQGWYAIVDEDGVIEDKNVRMKEVETPEFMMKMLKRKDVHDAITSYYKMAGVGKTTLSDEFDVNMLED